MAPRWRREVTAVIAAELGAPPETWVDVANRGDVPALDEGGGGTLVLSFIGVPAEPARRQAALAAARSHVERGGTLVIVDHNRPRRVAAALAAIVAPPAPTGLSPGARWRRLAYPAAREAQAAGFRVERLRFAAAERVQIVIAGGVARTSPTTG